MIKRLRKFLWHLLGFDYRLVQMVVDNTYLKMDVTTSLGRGSYINRALEYRWGNSGVTIGKYSSIADNAVFIVDDGKHTYNNISTFPFQSNKISPKQGITIGNDVWIGINAIILNGITIGDGAVIAAGAIVTKDVEPYTIVGGSPARVLKHRCSEQEAKAMQQIAWWDWDESKITNNLPFFKLSFKQFIDKFEAK